MLTSLTTTSKRSRCNAATASGPSATVHHLVPGHPQCLADEHAQVVLVFHQQQAQLSHPTRFLARRQAQADRGAFAGAAAQRGETAGLRGEAEHLAQAQARAPADVLGGEERLHRAFGDVRAHAFAVVDDIDAHVGPRFGVRRVGRTDHDQARAHHDGAAGAHRIATVGDQVEDGGLELAGIDFHQRQVLRELEAELHRRAARAPVHFAGAVEQRVDVVHLRRQVLPAREGEQLAREQRAAVGGALRGLGPFEHARVAVVAHDDQVQAVDDHRQQVVEVVRQAKGELADGLQLLRLRQRLLRLLQAQQRLVAFGDVARDLGETDQRVVLPDRVDDHAGAKTRAVLAQPPALGLELALGARRFQPTRRLAARDVLRRVEAGEVLADDLAVGVALDALAAGIPAADVAVRIEHVDGVVGNAADQQRELARLVVQPSRRGGDALRRQRVCCVDQCRSPFQAVETSGPSR